MDTGRSLGVCTSKAVHSAALAIGLGVAASTFFAWLARTSVVVSTCLPSKISMLASWEMYFSAKCFRRSGCARIFSLLRLKLLRTRWLLPVLGSIR
jgi:hypothetical protein